MPLNKAKLPSRPYRVPSFPFPGRMSVTPRRERKDRIKGIRGLVNGLVTAPRADRTPQTPRAPYTRVTWVLAPGDKLEVANRSCIIVAEGSPLPHGFPEAWVW